MTVSSSIIKPFFLFFKTGWQHCILFLCLGLWSWQKEGLEYSSEINYWKKIFTVTSKFSALKASDHTSKECVPGVQNVYEHTNGS